MIAIVPVVGAAAAGVFLALTGKQLLAKLKKAKPSTSTVTTTSGTTATKPAAPTGVLSGLLTVAPSPAVVASTVAAAVPGKKAIVTTQDPSPMGDLIIRTAPNPSAPQIPGGGADKNGVVDIIRDVDGTWAEIYWPGGNRPAGRGYARKAYLRVL